MELRETAGAVENLKLLQDPQSGVDAAFIAGGISNGKQAPGLLSLGIIYNNAFWVFYSSSLSIEHLPQLKGKRIAVGPVGSATRQAAERILGLAGVTKSTATFLPFAVYKNGPSFMQRHIPLWLSAHIQRLIAVIATVIAVVIPLFHYLPMLYRWTVRRRLLYWYGRLQAVESSIDSNPSGKHLTEVQIELQRIDEAVSRIHFPLAFSDQVYNLRSHIEIVRRRTAPRENLSIAAE